MPFSKKFSDKSIFYELFKTNYLVIQHILRNFEKLRKNQLKII